MTHDNKLQVEAIKRGTVIDHIPAQIGFKLLSLFKLTETDQRITIGLNLPSGEMGRKDLIKIENTFLSEDQVDQLALYAPLKRRTKNAKAFHDKCENFSFRASNETAVLITAFYSLHGDHLGYG